MKKERNTHYILIGVLAGFALLLILFAGIILVRTASSYLDGAGTNSSSALSRETEEKLKILKNHLNANYLFGTEGTDFDTAVIRAYVDALNDPYTVYYTPEEYEALMESNSGVYYGIGVSVQQDLETMEITVVKVFRDSPAKEAGVMEGDVLSAVNGDSVAREDLQLVVSKIRGDAGTKVKLTLFRPSEKRSIDLEVERREIQAESVSGMLLEDGIAYLELTSFDDVTYSQFVRTYNELVASGMEGLIVDLRNNGGGLLSSVVRILDKLLPEGLITYTEDREGRREEYRSDADSVLKVPLVLLVNEYTASASEIFTGAMKDYGLATVVGTKTFGKGIVQVIIGLKDGSGLKVTTSRYYTPNGICIHGTGIEPDVKVEAGASEEDVQLNEAIRVLKGKMN